VDANYVFYALHAIIEVIIHPKLKEFTVSTMEQRSAARKEKITISKMALHSEEHHSFHPHLELKKAWELLTRLSKEAWIEKTGKIPPTRVDKSIVKFTSLKSMT